VDLFLRKGGVTAKTMGSFLSNTTTKPVAVKPAATLSVFCFILFCLHPLFILHFHSLFSCHFRLLTSLSLSFSLSFHYDFPAKAEWALKFFWALKKLLCRTWYYVSASIFLPLVLWAIIFSGFCSKLQFSCCHWVCFCFFSSFFNIFISATQLCFRIGCSGIL